MKSPCEPRLGSSRFVSVPNKALISLASRFRVSVSSRFVSVLANPLESHASRFVPVCPPLLT